MKIYSCRTGDSVRSLCEKFKISPSRLLALNSLQNSRSLTPGLSLLIPEFKVNRPEIELGMEIPPYLPQSSFEAYSENLSFCCPLSCKLSGDELLTRPAGDSALSQKLCFKGAVPLLGISNLSSSSYSSELLYKILSSIESRDRFIQKILNFVSEFSCLGVYLELSGIPPFSENFCCRFIEELSEALHNRGLYFISALFYETGLKALLKASQKCCDRLIFPAYDERHIQSPPGYLCSLDELDKKLNDIIKLIDPEKILLALSDYALCWPADENPGREAGIITNSCARNLAVSCKAHINASDSGSYFDYRDFTGREQLIYFEDFLSLSKKFSLAESKKLAGIYIKRPSSDVSGLLGFLNAEYGFKKYI